MSVPVQFFTQIQKYAIEDSETSLLVPVTLKRMGLNKIVHHLLEDEENRIPFEFLVDGKIIRNKDLSQVLAECGKSAEETLIIEYIPALSEPKESSEKKHEDWVSCIATIPSDDLVVSGDFSGSIYLWSLVKSSSTEMLHCVKISNSPIKSVSFFTTPSDGKKFLVAGGIDQQLYLLQITQKNKLKLVSQSKGHSDSILSLASDSSMTFSGSHSGEILCWTHEMKLAGTLPNHRMAVTALSLSRDSKYLVSGSLDRNIKTHDLTSGLVSHTKTCDTAVIDLVTVDNGITYSCHSDSFIRLWDGRSSNEGGSCQKIYTKSMFNSCLSIQSNSVLCGSFDGSVKVYDVRSSQAPLLVLKKEENENKVFCCDYSLGPTTIMYGCEDRKLHVRY